MNFIITIVTKICTHTQTNLRTVLCSRRINFKTLNFVNFYRTHACKSTHAFLHVFLNQPTYLNTYMHVCLYVFNFLTYLYLSLFSITSLKAVLSGSISAAT